MAVGLALPVLALLGFSGQAAAAGGVQFAKAETWWGELVSCRAIAKLLADSFKLSRLRLFKPIELLLCPRGTYYSRRHGPVDGDAHHHAGCHCDQAGSEDYHCGL